MTRVRPPESEVSIDDLAKCETIATVETKPSKLDDPGKKLKKGVTETNLDTTADVDKSAKRPISRQLDLSKMDVKKIKELGFPVRLLFEEFIDRYKMLVFSSSADIEPTAEHCRFIAKRAGLREYEIGEDKVKEHEL
ncbi:unconventional myosin-XVI-like [Physella acuta]|uniref:unconventional myosin-XVI-like n=1 Tax=Physella acuta TaxID=109671 RepID=UPI0027DC62EF|nr:unconventional myosin-XVI-like [Physella acuta]